MSRFTALLTLLAAASMVSLVSAAAVNPYNQTVLDDNPFVYYTFDEDSGATGSTSQDATTFNRDGTYAGPNTPIENDTPIMLEGPFGGFTSVGQAPHFDGPPTNNNVDGTTFQPATFSALTLELWAKSDTATWNENGSLVSKRNAFIMHPDAGGANMRFFIHNGGFVSTSFDLSSISGFSIEDWHHYVGTYDQTDTGQELKFYVDGILRATASATGNITADSGVMTIGRDDGSGSRFFDGRIDEVAIFDRALSAAEIQEHFNAAIFSIPEPSTGLLAALGVLAVVRQRRRRGAMDRC